MVGIAGKIKVLHIAQAAGGVDCYLRMLLKYLNSERFENILICSQDYKLSDYEELVVVFQQVYMVRAIGYHDFQAVKEIRYWIKKYKPEIVYAHSSKAGTIARLANIGIRNKCIYNPHGWAFNMRCSARKQNFYAFVEKIMALFCKKIICISEAEKQSAIQRRICRESKLQVIFNGIDIEAYENAEHGKLKREDAGIPENAFVVGMVGRISVQKAPDIFIKAAKIIKDFIPNAFFVIVGSGEQEAEIKAYAKENNFVDLLHITGWVENAMSYIELFDVACLLSRWEGFGLVLPEYMLAGKPIVATRADAIPDIIEDRKNGILVGIDNVQEVARAVEEIFTNQVLEQEILTNNSCVVQERFNVKRVAAEHEILFEQLMMKKKK